MPPRDGDEEGMSSTVPQRGFRAALAPEEAPGHPTPYTPLLLGKTAPAPPWLRRRSTHHLYPRREARAQTASPPPTCKARINSHPVLAKAPQRRQSYWKVSLVKGLVPVCQSTPQGADNKLFLFYDYLWVLVLISLAWITGRRMQKSIKAQCSVMT